jgi:hypothetical protein
VVEGGCFFDFFPRRFVFFRAIMMVIAAPGYEIRSDETSSPEKQVRRESAELIRGAARIVRQLDRAISIPR